MIGTLPSEIQVPLTRIIAPSDAAQGYAVASNSGKDGSPRTRRANATAATQKTPAGPRNAVRIIGGDWRGRRIRFPSLPTLRPTPDRVRETLFNWLQGVIGGARCLDLFAGSGALGLEALSRGAGEVVFVEAERRVAAGLEATLQVLGADRARVVAGDAFRYLAGPARPFDVAFLDPPFAKGWLPELCKLLEERGWLAPGAYVYLERAAREGDLRLPDCWTVLRETRAGEVVGMLARRAAPLDPQPGAVGVPTDDT